MSRHHQNLGRPYRRARAQVLGQSDICGICGHPGSDSVDHIVPVSLGGPPDDVRNLRPAHLKPCPLCGRTCNGSRSNKLTVQPAPTPPSRRWY